MAKQTGKNVDPSKSKSSSKTQSGSSSSRGTVLNGKGTADELNNILDNASSIVFKAAHILEEEVARGIVAAKQIEEKIVDPAKLRRKEGDPENKASEELLIRFRKDAHDIVDLLVDLATLASENASQLSSRLIKNIAKDPEDGKVNPKDTTKG